MPKPAAKHLPEEAIVGNIVTVHGYRLTVDESWKNEEAINAAFSLKTQVSISREGNMFSDRDAKELIQELNINIKNIGATWAFKEP